MMLRKLLSYGILLLLTLQSCMVYSPQMSAIPLISEKNELRVDGSLSLMLTANGTVSYGITDQFAVQAFGNWGTNSYYHLAAGYYKEVMPSTILEVYGGFGYGLSSVNNVNSYFLKGNYQVYFAQINFGQIATEESNFEAGCGLKIGYMNSTFTNNGYYESSLDDFYVNSTYPVSTDHRNSLVIEPTFFLRVGGEHVRWNLKVGGTYLNNLTPNSKYLPYSFINCSTGLSFRFNCGKKQL